MMDGGSVPAQGHQKAGLNRRTSISQLQKSSAGGRLSTAEKTDLWYLKLGLAISPSLLLWRPEWCKAPGSFDQKYSFHKRFCRSKWEAEGRFAKAHGVPSKRKIRLKLCLGTGFIGVLWIVEYYRLFVKTCRAELSAGSRFWHGQGAS